MSWRDNKFFILLKILRAAYGNYKWQILLMAALSFLSGILEGIGINVVIPIFSVIEGGGVNDLISQTIQKVFLYFHLILSVKHLIILIALLFVAKSVLYFLNQYITAKITSEYEQNTRAELFRAMLVSDWSYLAKQKVGWLDQVLTTDVKGSSALLGHVGTLIIMFSNLAIYSLIAINISFLVAMLALAAGGAISLVFKPLFYKNRIASTEINQKHKDLAHYVNENVIGMKTVKSMMVGDEVFKKGSVYFERMKDLRMRVEWLKNFTSASFQPIVILFVIGIFAIFYKTAAFNFASFMVIIYAINRVFGSVQLAQSEAHIISSLVPNLMSVLDYKKNATQNFEVDRGTEKFNFRDRLEFQDVSFFYDADSRALTNISFFVKRGEMLGLVGPSGAGKTTLVDLFLRLLDPQSGRIVLDGRDIKNISLREWRGGVGYVSQDVFLMNDTVGNNIRFYDREISDEDIIAAAKTANIYDFISKQSQGMETVVGERGLSLSGGQRQRIALARVLARKPQVLILDEATSALDNESEILIQEAIEKLKGGVTVIAIAHRLSTVLNADRLLVLERGRIIEEGTPKELLADETSYFAKTYNLRK